MATALRLAIDVQPKMFSILGNMVVATVGYNHGITKVLVWFNLSYPSSVADFSKRS